MSTCQDGLERVKYVPEKKWRRFGKSSCRSARSLSRSFNHLFRRKNSYSFLSARKKSQSAFEIINFSQGVTVTPVESHVLGQAHVWGVRNYFSKSAVEDLQFDFDPDQGSRPRAIMKDENENKSNDKSEESLKDSGIATSGESESEDKRLDTDNEADGQKQTNAGQNQICNSESGNLSAVDFRSRLQSFGSSQCNSDSLSISQGCSYSSSPREPSMSDWASIDSLDSMDTSYWDLPIDSSSLKMDSLSYGGSLRPRRYSESMVKNRSLADGSPRLRMELARRRMSEGLAIRYGDLYHRSNRSNSISDRRDSLSLREQLMVPKQERDVYDGGLSSEASISEISDTGCVHHVHDRNTPREHSAVVRPVTNSSCFAQKPRRHMLQRSQSVDSRRLQKAYKNFKRNSLIASQRAAFSDIESSDESPNAEANSSDKVIHRRNRHKNIRSSSVRAQARSNGRHANRNSVRSSVKYDIENDANLTQASLYEDKTTGNESLSNSVEFLSVKDVVFCSGEHGSLASGGDDMKTIIDAVQNEASKTENADKDMMVMFLVGGEFKVLRRAALPSHGERSLSDIPSMTRKDPFSFHNGSNNYSYGHSVHDVNRGRPKSAVIITRSQSFAGMANQPSTPRRDSQAVVLGESFRHHHRGPSTLPAHTKPAPGSRGAVGFSFKKSPKVPKVPRPNRALLMFQSVKRGIREFIEATKDDIFQLQQREPDGTSTAQQLRSAERYMKRLEFHLAKLDELHEYYLLQQQLREGVRTMHRAYVTSPGTKRTPLSNVKYGYKECTQTMCNIEAQLEAMMGTFNCKLKGIAGFARLCPGDVFEVTTRHGTQKWKTKGRIEKSGNQKWDIPDFNFKAVVGDVINIKGVEVRPFKSVLLGQKSCETKDLFSANPQLMTVSINVNGSLKLSIVIIWNPLDGVDENFTFIDTPLRSQSTPRRTRPVSVLALNGQYNDFDDLQPDRRRSNPVTTMQQTKDDNFILRTNAPSPVIPDNVTSYHGLDSPHVVARHSEHLPAVYQANPQSGPILSQTFGHAQAGFHSNPVVSGNSQNFTQPANQSSFHSSVYEPFSHLHFPSVTSHRHENGDDSGVVNIEDVLHNLSSSLEDYHGQYLELQNLEELIKVAQKLMRKQFRNSSRSSSISVSIESALEAFDFLDTEDTLEEPQSPADNTKSSFDDLLCSPESTAKTADSGIESLAQRLSEDHTQLGSSLDSSPTPPSTGNEEVDQCLVYHLTYCERLLENLGAFGPLKCHEIYALDKLQKQTTIIDSLLKLAKSGSQPDLHSVMSSLCDDKSLREFWVKCTDQNSLYVHPDRLVSMLEQKYATVIQEKYLLDPTKVCQHVITRILDIPDYEKEKTRSTFVMTLHQYMTYFKEEGGLKHVEDVAIEMKLVERLTSGIPDVVIKAILSLRDTIPSSPCLKVIGMLLVTMDTEVEQCTISYLNLIQKRAENRDKAMVVFVEGLEDQTPEIRAGACSALAILEASESTDQLVYLWQSDSSQLVQQKAKATLLSLGEEGKKAFEDAQLSKHGFQGLQVHK